MRIIDRVTIIVFISILFLYSLLSNFELLKEIENQNIKIELIEKSIQDLRNKIINEALKKVQYEATQWAER